MDQSLSGERSRTRLSCSRRLVILLFAVQLRDMPLLKIVLLVALCYTHSIRYANGCISGEVYIIMGTSGLLAPVGETYDDGEHYCTPPAVALIRINS